MKIKIILLFTIALAFHLLTGGFILPLSSQETDITINDIEQFAEVINEQTSKSILPPSDLSDHKVLIYWIYPDRRGALAFRNRIQSYTGQQNCQLIYRWSWPDPENGQKKMTKGSKNDNKGSFKIFVIDDNIPVPAPFSSMANIHFIRIGSIPKQKNTDLTLPHALPSMMDLAAQYLMGGIATNEDGIIESGKRLSYLPASYFKLDQNRLHDELDSILQMGLDSSAYPGAETIVVYKGSVIYQKNIGYHTSEQNFRVRTHDLYDLASVTKVAGGINALMTLYDQGKFDIRDRLQDYFPYFRRSDKGALNMQRILTHSAGLMPYMVYYQMAEKKGEGYAKNTLSKSRHGHYSYKVTDSLYVSDRFNRYIYKAIKESPLTPGHSYKYSGLFFLLIPDLVRDKTGIPLDQFLYDNIFHPLGATNTLYNPGFEYNIHQIVPTEKDDFWRYRLVHGQVHDEAAVVLGGVSANAGLFSTAEDLAKIGETWRNNGSYGGKQFWKPETIQTFTRCYYCDEGNRRALGFDRPPSPELSINSYMSPLASQESYGHSGFTGTIIWVDPTYEYTFVFLSNRVYPNRKNAGLSTLNIRPELHSVLYKLLNVK